VSHAFSGAKKVPDFLTNVEVVDKFRGKTTTLFGTVDLRPSLDRIKSGELLDEFRNDGSVFKNISGRLPANPSNYYREYVHPTPGIAGRPGPQRIIIGRGGEMYYTPKHYDFFIPLN
jgi:filamentous hemagglutinin